MHPSRSTTGYYTHPTLNHWVLYPPIMHPSRWLPTARRHTHYTPAKKYLIKQFKQPCTSIYYGTYSLFFSALDLLPFISYSYCPSYSSDSSLEVHALNTLPYTSRGASNRSKAASGAGPYCPQCIGGIRCSRNLTGWQANRRGTYGVGGVHSTTGYYTQLLSIILCPVAEPKQGIILHAHTEPVVVLLNMLRVLIPSRRTRLHCPHHVAWHLRIGVGTQLDNGASDPRMLI